MSGIRELDELSGFVGLDCRREVLARPPAVRQHVQALVIRPQGVRRLEGIDDGGVELGVTGVVIGGVVVAPTASELILPIALAVQNKLTVGDLAQTLSVYPSLSGSITEAARQLVRHDDLD